MKRMFGMTTRTLSASDIEEHQVTGDDGRLIRVKTGTFPRPEPRVPTLDEQIGEFQDAYTSARNVPPYDLYG